MMVFSYLKNSLSFTARFLGIHTAIAFVAVGAAFIGLVIIPVRRLLLGEQSVEDNRRVISQGVRLYLAILEKTRLLELEVEGVERAYRDAPVVFVANHPSLLDALYFIREFPTCALVIKSN